MSCCSGSVKFYSTKSTIRRILVELVKWRLPTRARCVQQIGGPPLAFLVVVCDDCHTITAILIFLSGQFFVRMRKQGVSALTHFQTFALPLPSPGTVHAISKLLFQTGSRAACTRLLAGCCQQCYQYRRPHSVRSDPGNATAWEW